MGPQRYFELRRLHALKARLRAADAADATVTRVAADLGFTEFGRMAVAYRRHFGERPSETLRRS